ncbi:hypothetical protein ANCCAN_12402 [Ancylostoma caninum]|uniref:Phosphorylase b kinase regulatory subunit n=1 Tax=Ancylostoma caninum TaxID=29170 RepID=A0A368GB67_ANCCA|nr:hypothetical protein ANCCAN_12402 [Ancylostoma caninum]
MILVEISFSSCKLAYFGIEIPVCVFAEYEHRGLLSTRRRSSTAINEFKKNCIYDLSPTVVKDVVTALMTRKNWHLLSPLQTRRLNGALNRMPVNFFDRVWTILGRSRDGIVIASQFLPQVNYRSHMSVFFFCCCCFILSISKNSASLTNFEQPEVKRILSSIIS